MSKRKKKQEAQEATIKDAQNGKKPISFHLSGLINRSLVVGVTRSLLSGLAIALIFFLFKSQPTNPVILGSVNTAPEYSVFKKVLLADDLKPDDISAKSAIVVSTKKNKILFEKNAYLKLPPASTTKILTALLAIREFNLDEVVEVPELCTKVDTSTMGLKPQEKIDVESLLYGLLVSSAGDAACTLSTHKFSQASFIAKMNLLAQDIGLTNTTLSNAIGLDADEVSHVSTAKDLYLMTKEAIKNGTFRKIVGTKEVLVYSDDKLISHRLRSTNELLFEVPGTLGVKTGKTPRAKEVLVYAYQKGDDEIIIVVMGSDARFDDARRLLKFAVENYEYF